MKKIIHNCTFLVACNIFFLQRLQIQKRQNLLPFYLNPSVMSQVRNRFCFPRVSLHEVPKMCLHEDRVDHKQSNERERKRKKQDRIPQ